MSTPNHRKLSSLQLEAVARLFAVLAEPNRLNLLQVLRDGPRTVGELVEACSMKQANVSRHLAVLHDHRLVKRQRLGIKIRYEIDDPSMLSLCSLVCAKVERDSKELAALYLSQ
jgi:DNA-binding transcriptional ArsR family regulator